MTDVPQGDPAERVSYRAIVTFVADAEQVVDPIWTERVQTILNGLGEIAGVGQVYVRLEQIHPANRDPRGGRTAS